MVTTIRPGGLRKAWEPDLGLIAQELRASQPTQPVIWKPALTKFTADAGGRIGFSKTALSCSESFSGGAVGYATATTVRRTTWSSAPTRRSSQRTAPSRNFGQPARAPSSSSVEKDEDNGPDRLQQGRGHDGIQPSGRKAR